jgi:GNAT superfamily N-acetyltransferase
MVDFNVTTDKSRLDIAEIHRFLVEESYWAAERTLEQTRIAIENSLCFAIFAGKEFAAFGRVVTDKATFAYVGDVFVKVPFRGHGLGKMLIKEMLLHPELQGLRRWILATRDAHSLYRQFGFSDLKFPERWMERPAPNAY